MAERHQVLKVIAAAFVFWFYMMNLSDRHKPSLFKTHFAQRMSLDIFGSYFPPLPVISFTAFIASVPFVIFFVMYFLMFLAVASGR